MNTNFIRGVLEGISIGLAAWALVSVLSHTAPVQKRTIVISAPTTTQAIYYSPVQAAEIRDGVF